MALSFTSCSCIAVTMFIFAMNVYLLKGAIYDAINMEEMYHIRHRYWNTWEGFLGNIQTRPYLKLIYIVVIALLSLLAIVGVVKRKVYLMLPLWLIIPIGLFYSEDSYCIRREWILKYIVVLSVLFALYYPLIAVWREIRQENLAKRRHKELF